MDTSNKGKIDMEELRVGLHKLGHQIPEADLQILMEAVSLTRSFKISLLCVGLIWDTLIFFSLMGLK